MKDFLINKKSSTEEWAIDSGTTKNIATITFVDGVFHSCQFYAKNPYTRENWRMLAFIESKITEIEEYYDKVKKAQKVTEPPPLPKRKKR